VVAYLSDASTPSSAEVYLDAGGWRGKTDTGPPSLATAASAAHEVMVGYAGSKAEELLLGGSNAAAKSNDETRIRQMLSAAETPPEDWPLIMGNGAAAAETLGAQNLEAIKAVADALFHSSSGKLKAAEIAALVDASNPVRALDPVNSE
jgi:hypothetical protein